MSPAEYCTGLFQRGGAESVRPNGEKLIMKSMDIKMPNAPTPMRIHPIAWMSIPETVVVVESAKTRTAPTAIRNRLNPRAGTSVLLDQTGSEPVGKCAVYEAG